MANTYKLIDKAILTGSQTAIDFTGLGSYSSNYTDLQLVLSLRNSRSGEIIQEGFITFNNSSTGYSERILRGNGSVSISNNSSSTSFLLNGFPAGGATANTFGNASIYIPNFSSGNYKSASAEFITENNATTAYAYMNALLWSSTAAITSIKIDAGSYSWESGSSAYLYGIKNS